MTSSEAHVIAAGGASTWGGSVIEGLYRPEESYEELQSLIPQPGEIQEEFHSATLAPDVVANIVAVTTRILASIKQLT